MGTNILDETRVMNSARRLVRALAGSARTVETESGISGAQLFVLRSLDASELPVSINELAELTLTHQSTVSGVVSRLVGRRLVKRSRSLTDARRVELVITTRGRKLLSDAPPTVQSLLVDGLARMSRLERATLASSLECWLDASGVESGDTTMFLEKEPSDARKRP